jgi:hypothetical protein
VDGFQWAEGRSGPTPITPFIDSLPYASLVLHSPVFCTRSITSNASCGAVTAKLNPRTNVPRDKLLYPARKLETRFTDTSSPACPASIIPKNTFERNATACVGCARDTLTRRKFPAVIDALSGFDPSALRHPPSTSCYGHRSSTIL